jgi:hypothetical protein
VRIDPEKGKPDRVLYFGFKGLGFESYELKEKDEYCVPVPAIIVDNKDNILDELAKLERSGTPHRVLQYHKDLLIVEKRVEFVN